MRVEELFEGYQQARQLSQIAFYHGGRVFDKFSLDHVGSGENNHLLGRGIYFINNKNIAGNYRKYAGAPEYDTAIYEVTLRFRGMVYQSIRKTTPEEKEAFDSIAKELGLTSYQDLYDVRGINIMKDGRGLIGGVAKLAGQKRAFDLFRKYGIQGQVEEVGSGMYEVAVFEPSVIQIVNREVISGTKPKLSVDEEREELISTIDFFLDMDDTLDQILELWFKSDSKLTGSDPKKAYTLATWALERSKSEHDNVLLKVAQLAEDEGHPQLLTIHRRARSNPGWGYSGNERKEFEELASEFVYSVYGVRP